MKIIDAVANYGTLHRMFFARAEDLGEAPPPGRDLSGERGTDVEGPRRPVLGGAPGPNPSSAAC